MTSAAHALLRGSLLIILLAGGMVWTSCDLASAGNTAILNANSTFPPTVQHRFEYAEEDVVEGKVMVESKVELDDLDVILSRNGFSRRDVVDARVDSVRVTHMSGPSLKDVKLFLRMSAEDTPIAQVQSLPDETSLVVDGRSEPVTAAIQNGAGTLHGRFGVESPRGGVVRAKVHYRLEVEGV